MGQPVTAIEKKSSRPDIVRFDINRSLTGMGHERYTRDTESFDHRPTDMLAERLLEFSEVSGVHINSNVITITVDGAADTAAMKKTIEDMFLYWLPGMVPPTDEEVIAAAAAK